LSGSGAEGTAGRGDLPLTLSGTTNQVEGSPAALTMLMPISIYASVTAHPENYFDILLPEFIGAVDATDFEITEQMRIISTVQSRQVMLVREFIQIVTTPQTYYLQSTELLETALLVAVSIPSYSLWVQDSLGVTSTVTVVQVIELAEELVAAGMVQTVYQGTVAVVSALLVGDGVIPAYAKSVSDALTVSDSLLELVRMLALLTDGVGVADTLQNVLIITVLETAEMALDDTIELSAQYLASLIDRATVTTLIKTPAELAQGWVMNTEANMPISEYDNYVFNSLAYGPDQMLGCTDEGLYILEGEDDAGTDIDAEVVSLMLDFDTSKLKRMSTAYIGYTSDGQLLLKVRSIDQGLYAEDWYAGRNTTAQTTPGQNRMKIGKGLRSRYWTFELVNIAGSDFELDKVELYPIVLQRRV
jgi:hypothetical protein